MQRAIKPDWLLRQASDLVGSGPGQPRNANLRRAVSAAYYALYHHMVLTVVGHVMDGCAEEDQLAACRNFEHGGVKTVCGWVAVPSQCPQPETARRVAENSDLLDVALTLPQLRQARMEADYDHLANFTKATALTRISQARTAMRSLDNTAGSPAYVAFLALLAMKANPVNRK